MHTESIERWVHDHTFGQDEKKSAERRTLIVSIVTVLTMVVEIVAGLAFGSMALLADGLHMGSHASALAISVFAYRYTRTHAKDARFNFGTGKVNSLAAFASATMLALIALAMAWESIARFLSPVAIGFNQAILVAVLGLIVNGACLAILGGHGHSQKGGREQEDATCQSIAHARAASRHHPPCSIARPQDHNFRSAYLHVLADALTSVLAIFALLAGKYLGQQWLDPFMGLVGATLVVHWSWGLAPLVGSRASRSAGPRRGDGGDPEGDRIGGRQSGLRPACVVRGPGDLCGGGRDRLLPTSGSGQLLQSPARRDSAWCM